MKIFYTKSISFIVLICATLLSFFSCSNLNEPVREFFEYYTDSAAIVKMQMNDSYEVDASGRKCYGSDSDKSIDLYLRNPQRYDINFDYKYNLSGLESVIAAPSVPFTIIQDPRDKARATLTFKKDFLEAVDNGVFTVYGTTIQKNISGDIRLTEKGTGRPFDSFHIDLSANTKPPRFRYSMFQRKGTKNTAGTCFILCMNIPKLAGTVHEKDTHDLYIGKDHWTFSGNISSDADLVADARNSYTLTTSEPTTLYSLDGGDKVFENPDPSTYTSLYYIIDDKSPEKIQGNLKILLKLIDDTGLYSSILVSNMAEQLKEPLVQNNEGIAVTSNARCPADDTTGYFELVLTHSKGTFHFDENGDPIDGADLKAMPQIVYDVTKNGIPYAQGTARAPVKINLPPDSNHTYSVTAYAIENGYVDSKEIDSVTGIKVTRSTNYYVNQNGRSKADGANGSPMHPYKNMQQCIEDINADTDNGNGPFTIYMQTDIEAQDSDFNSGSCQPYISIPASKKITIQGLNGLKTLNLNRSKTKKGYGIDLSAGELTLKDIKITGGVYEDNDGSGGIDYNSTGKLSISGTVILDGNYYIDGSGTLKSNNIFARGSIDNINKIYITGPISGTRIGIYTSSIAPTVAQSIQFTEGYNTYNSGVKPAKYFFSDGGFGITDKEGEAVLAVNGGSMGDVISSQSMTFECAEYENAAAASKFIKFYPGFAKEITITPTIKLYGTAVNTDNTIWNSVTWTTWLTCDGTEITGTRRSSTGNAIKGVIPATGVYEENYMLNVKAILNGVSYDESWPVKGKKDISYMSAAPATPGTYGIASSDGLKKLKNWVNAGYVAGRTYVFELSDDIVAESGVGNIGTSAKPFMATFDGKGHTISGLNIDTSDGACGLFAYIDSTTVKNVTIEGNVSGTYIAGMAAGLVGKANNSSITNCTNKATVNKNNNDTFGLAGICNTASNTIIDGCVNEGNVISSGTYTAGILAQGSGTTTVKNCVNKGQIRTTARYAAGIVGEIASSDTVVIDGCRNEGEVISQTSYAAGIATGGSSSSIIRNCINTGEITSGSTSTAGGIQPAQNVNIYNCYNTGTINTSSGSAGGIVARGSTSYVLSNCFSYASINGSNKGNISGNSTSNAASINNYFIVKSDTSAQKGAGNSTAAPYTYDSVTYWDSWTQISQSITVGTYNGQDVKDLLNAWIDSQSNPSLYKRWKYDAGGIPVFDE